MSYKAAGSSQEIYQSLLDIQLPPNTNQLHQYSNYFDCWRFSFYLLLSKQYSIRTTLFSVSTIGEWFGDGRRSSATALNAVIGLVVFGYPGFMYAVFGRFTWRPETGTVYESENYDDSPADRDITM